MVLSKEKGSLPPSAGNTAAPSRFGELLAGGDSSGCSRTEVRLAVLEGIQEAISVDRSHPLNAFALAASAAFVPVHTLSACMP